jgi:hypothetical protein
MARIATRAVAVMEVVSPDDRCLDYIQRLVLTKERGRTAATIYTERGLQELLLAVCSEPQILHFDQYIDIALWLDAGDLPSDTKEELYTFALPWVPVEFRNLRLIAKVNVKKNKLKKTVKGGKDPSRALKRKRPCFSNGKFVNTPVYDSSRLKPGNVIRGPAIVEEPTTTVVIPKGFDCILDEYENYVIRRV